MTLYMAPLLQGGAEWWSLGTCRPKEVSILVNTFIFLASLPSFLLPLIPLGAHDVYNSIEVVNQVLHELGGKITQQQGPLCFRTDIAYFFRSRQMETCKRQKQACQFVSFN